MNNFENDYSRVEKALIFIQKNYKEQPDLNEIAEHVHLSPYHFNRLFRKWAGVTPKKFLQFITLKEAKSRLKNNLSLEEIAYDIGLSSGSRLYDLFVNFEGITPGEFKVGGENLKIYYSLHSSMFGNFFIAVTDRGICNLTFTQKLDWVLDKLRNDWPNADLIYSPERAGNVADKLFDVSDSDDKKFNLLVKGNKYQLNIWQAVLNIPFGSIVTYEKLAEYVGIELNIDSIEKVLLDNPVKYLIPCHRVIKNLTSDTQFNWGNPRMLSMLGWEASVNEGNV